MDDAMHEFARWQAHAAGDAELAGQLAALEKNGPERQDSFCRNLAFGTGGLRGVMGAGPGRMNVYTVRKATRGYAAWLKKHFPKPAVAIAYDSRHHSPRFARQAAGVLAAMGVRAFIYPRLMPTPALSFAVRRLGCAGGICITASHNPASYNGYKVYGPGGCQITDGDARAIQGAIDEADFFAGDAPMPFEEGVAAGRISVIPEAVVQDYLAAVSGCRVGPEPLDNLRVVYTPLHGAGLECVEKALVTAGVRDLRVVASQREPDGDFPTCPSPNPEEDAALAEGLRLCEETGADILLATDPDCDRLGVAVCHEGAFVRLSGNEVGVLLLHYLATRRAALGTLPENPVAIKTIVTTDMAAAVAADLGITLAETLTGFKYIGEQVSRLETAGCADRFILGFEESCGYLPGSYVRDKDGVSACLLVCEMAAWHKSRGRDLVSAMADLYAQYGCYETRLLSLTFPGEAGMAQMALVMAGLRQAPPKALGGDAVCAVTDYSAGTIPIPGGENGACLPAADVLALETARGGKVIVRPSGTEAKLKIYLSACSATGREAAGALDLLEGDISGTIDRLSREGRTG